MKKLVLLSLFASLPAFAAPFIVSDAYPPTDLQPTHCEAVEGTNVWANAVAVNVDGSVYCNIDLAGVSRGRHSVIVYATSTTEGVVNSDGVPFVFSNGKLLTPANPRLSQ